MAGFGTDGSRIRVIYLRNELPILDGQVMLLLW
jgi:hypothetical protein